MNQLLFSRAMSIFMKSGYHLEEAIDGSFAIISATEFPQSRLLLQQIHRGLPLSEGISRLLFLPRISAELISSAEKSGKYAEGFDQLNIFIAEIWDRRFQQISAWLNPLLFLVSGILITLILFGLYLPLFQLSDKI